MRLTGTFAEPRVSANVTGSATSAGLTSATVAGASATGGLSLLVQSTYNRFMRDPQPFESAIARRSEPGSLGPAPVRPAAHPKDAEDGDDPIASPVVSDEDEGGARGLTEGVGR